VAKEVDEHAFFHLGVRRDEDQLRAPLCLKMIDDRYSPFEWNIYPFHFSDGDNWSGGHRALRRTPHGGAPPGRQRVLLRPGEVAYGSGQFKKTSTASSRRTSG
jgi:hypothetical protein